MNILEAQISTILGIFLSMFGAFLLPLWLINAKSLSSIGSKYRIVLTQANCLSGGVFLATFFIGLMPEVRNLYHQVLIMYEISNTYPVTEFVIFVGFLLALAVEQCTLNYKEKHDNLYEKADNLSNNNNLELSHGHCHQDLATAFDGSNLRLGMLFGSLGIHSFFEGLALGLQTSSSTLFRLTVGVALHEVLMALALGGSVAKLGLSFFTFCKLATFFSLSIPVGQLLGLLLGQYRSNATLVISATLQGLAAGTFIHVIFMEIIPTEFSEKGHRLLKVFSIGLGFLLFFICTVLMQKLSHVSHWN